MDEATKDCYDPQAKQKVTVGALEGDDAANFLQWLMSARRCVQSGQISAEQALQEAKEWVVPEDDTLPH